MKETVTMDQALDSKAEETATAFAQCISEIDRHLEERHINVDTRQAYTAYMQASTLICLHISVDAASDVKYNC